MWIIEIKATDRADWRWTGVESLNSRHAWDLWDRQRVAGHITDYYAVQARLV